MSDGDKSIALVVEHEDFKSIKHLLCLRHVHGNVRDNCSAEAAGAFWKVATTPGKEQFEVQWQAMKASNGGAMKNSYWLLLDATKHKWERKANDRRVLDGPW